MELFLGFYLTFEINLLNSLQQVRHFFKLWLENFFGEKCHLCKSQTLEPP